MYTLNDICSVITDGSHFSPEDEGVGYPMLSVKDMGESDFEFGTCKHVGEEAFQKLLANGCKPEINDVVVAKDGSYLKTAFPIKEDRDIALLSSIAILRPKLDIVIPEYLSYFLKSESVYRTVSLNYISGTALKRVILKGIKKIPVALPTVEEQGRRTELLDRIHGIIQQRKKQLTELDDLIKARFVEMFGDPAENPFGWEKVNISTVINGKPSNGFFAKRDEYVDDGNVAVLGVAYVVNRMYSQVCDLPRTNADDNDIKKYSIKYGDMLFCRSSLVAAGIGKASIVPEDVPEKTLFECHVIRLPLDLEKCIPEFMQVLSTTDYFRNQMIAQSKTATMTTIGQDGIMKAMIIKPPIEKQKEFYLFVKQVDKSKKAVNESLTELQILFDSLMQKYFG